ncbi:MAG: hypothetical protein FJ077_12330, partial [Cyanobacteria bacterium K_DeepCast_35m_m2_023]|nr:hypothetical protein [Cyanobacteria bacterium K_DeepCast_35m_m2_023]
MASSKPALTTLQQGNQRRRARIDQLADALSRSAAQAFFVAQQGRQALRPNRAAIGRDKGQPLAQVHLAAQTYNLEAQPWGKAEGLDWLLITIISPDEALLRSQQQTAVAAVSGLLALGSALLINRQLISWLLAPMGLLRQRAEQALGRPAQRF